MGMGLMGRRGYSTYDNLLLTDTDTLEIDL
jgi:hypothetical protein